MRDFELRKKFRDHAGRLHAGESLVESLKPIRQFFVIDLASYLGMDLGIEIVKCTMVG